MKKIFTLSTLVLATPMLFAQQQPATLPDAPAEVTHHRPVIHQAPEERGGVIWSEDFGNGFPANWAIDDQSGICAWKWTDAGSHGYFNGNSGTTYGDTMNSTTASNGYLIADNDSANHFNFGQPSGSNYQYLSTWFITDAIDCSGEPAVKLEFEQFYRFNNTVDLIVQVSNDSANWTSYTVQAAGAANNAASANPELVSLNISGVAGNQSTVYLRIGWDARVYFWCIDDMAIIAAPTDDLSLNNPHWNAGIEYYTYRQDQAQPLTFSANVVNEGANAQTNVTLDVEVRDMGNNMAVFNGSSAPQSFAFLQSDSLTVSNTYTPNTLGQYSFNFSTSMDNTDVVPGNDMESFDIMVDQWVYARDNGIYQSQYWNGDNGNGAANAYEYGTTYEFFNAGPLNQIDVYIGANTDPGTLIYGVFYYIDAGGNFVYVDQTPDYTIMQSDIGDWISLNFNVIYNVPAGTDVIALVGHYGGDALYIGRATNDSPPQTSFLLDGTDNTWYYTTRMPMVRAVYFPDNIEENTAEVNFTVYPNPANENFAVEMSLLESNNVTVNVYDLSGRSVMTESLGKRAAGESKATFDISTLANGVYQVEVVAGNKASTQQLVVAH